MCPTSNIDLLHILLHVLYFSNSAEYYQFKSKINVSFNRNVA